ADHIVYGWGFFVAVTLFLIWVGLKFRDNAALPVPAAESVGAAPARRVIATAAVALVLALAAPASAIYLQTRPPAAPSVLVPPVLGDGWEVAAPTGWIPHFLSADVELISAYAKDGKRVDLYIAYYTHQQKGHELITYDNQIADGEMWRRIGGG